MDLLAELLGADFDPPHPKRRRLSSPSSSSPSPSQSPKALHQSPPTPRPSPVGQGRPRQGLRGGGISPLTSLPRELLCVVVTNLDLPERLRLSMTCKKLYHVVRDPACADCKALDVRPHRHDIADSTFASLLPLLAPGISSLALVRCHALTDASIDAVFSKCSAHTLERVTIQKCSQLHCSQLHYLLGFNSRSLTFLDLSYNAHLSPPTLNAVFQQCTNLDTVLLEHCPRVEATCASFLLLFTNVRHISLKGCPHLTDHAFSCPSSRPDVQVPQIPVLPPLSLRQLSTVSAVATPRTVGIVSLNVSRCAKLTDGGLHRLCQAPAASRDSLTHLDVSHCDALDLTSVLQFLCEAFPSLSNLCIRHTRVGTLALFSLLQLGHLAHLDASHCDQLRDHVFDLSPYPGSQQRTALTHLNLSDCVRLSDNGLAVISHTFPNLEVVDVSGCTDLSGPGLCAFARDCHRLRVLKMNDLIGLANAHVQQLKTQGTTLEHITAHRCDFVNPLVVRSVNAHFGTRKRSRQMA